MFLTDNDARNIFDCNRLASRISNLRQLGHHIVTAMVQTKSGKSIAMYFMPEAAGHGAVTECEKRGFKFMSIKT